jgi:hypothetical protein
VAKIRWVRGIAEFLGYESRVAHSRRERQHGNQRSGPENSKNFEAEDAEEKKMGNSQTRKSEEDKIFWTKRTQWKRKSRNWERQGKQANTAIMFHLQNGRQSRIDIFPIYWPYAVASSDEGGAKARVRTPNASTRASSAGGGEPSCIAMA